MIQAFKFRFRCATGGLAVDLRAEACGTEAGIPAHSVRIHRNIWLGLPASGLYWKDAAWLAFGVSLNAHALSELLPDGILVQVASLECPLSDYRSEAAALAMDGWLHQQFAVRSSGACRHIRPRTGPVRLHLGADRSTVLRRASVKSSALIVTDVVPSPAAGYRRGAAGLGSHAASGLVGASCASAWITALLLVPTDRPADFGAEKRGVRGRRNRVTSLACSSRRRFTSESVTGPC